MCSAVFVLMALTMSQSESRVLQPANHTCEDTDPMLKVMNFGHISHNNMQEIGRITHKDGSTDVFYSKIVSNACPEIVGQEINSHLRERSTCPWDHVIAVNEMRLPREISMVRCLDCRSCLDGTDNSANGCEAIQHEMSVLKKGDCTPEGVYEWISETIRITVGCTCAAKPSLSFSLNHLLRYDRQLSTH